MNNSKPWFRLTAADITSSKTALFSSRRVAVSEWNGPGTYSTIQTAGGILLPRLEGGAVNQHKSRNHCDCHQSLPIAAERIQLVHEICKLGGQRHNDPIIQVHDIKPHCSIPDEALL